MINHDKTDKILVGIKQSRESLECTRTATNLYFQLVKSGYVSKDAQDIVQSFSEIEWGEGTHCTFHTDKVVVENFDGRFEELTPEKCNEN
jgi:hypothetical protein